MFPHVQVVNLSFLSKPTIDFQLKPIGAGDINSIASISRLIDGIIDSALTGLIVSPNIFPINVYDIMNAETAVDAPVGILRILVFEVFCIAD